LAIQTNLLSDKKPTIETVDTYRKILESDAIIAETKRALIEKNILSKNSALQIGKNIETRIFASPRIANPLIEAVGRGKTPQLALEIVDAWTHSFLSAIQKINEDNVSSVLNSVETKYKEATTEYDAYEEQRKTLSIEFAKQIDQITDTWGGKINAFNEQTAELLNNYERETERLTGAFDVERNLFIRRRELHTLKEAYDEMQEEILRDSSALLKLKNRLTTMTALLQEIPHYIEVQKAVSDEALWREAGKDSQSTDWKKLQDRKLVTQEINPNYLQLQGDILKTETDIAELKTSVVDLPQNLERLAQKIHEMESALQSDEIQFSKLQKDRESGLSNLQARRVTELEMLDRQKEQELNEVNLEQDLKIGQINRDIQNQQQLVQALGKDYNRTLILNAQQAEGEVSLAALAVPPERAKSRHALAIIVAGAVLGALIGFLVALIKDNVGRPSARV